MPIVVSVDPNRCELHGECVLAAPEIFEIEDGAEVVTVRNARPADELREAALDAMYVCPMQAIHVGED